MPELPEVETIRRGIAPHLVGRRVQSVTLRRRDLRWPIPDEISDRLPGQTINAVRRRAKYLLLDTAVGTVLLHLGMSGSLRVLDGNVAIQRHDHLDVLLDSGQVLRFTDPRRFGCMLWQALDQVHPLLATLGPEPLTDAFNGEHLFALSRGRRAPIKTFLMDQSVVVGIGNIYAAEALFAAGIDPRRAAGRIARQRYLALARGVREILQRAIRRGGTTLRDFVGPDGVPGYFLQDLLVYGREGLPCRRCGSVLRSLRLGQRASVYCPRCQR